MSNFHNKNIFLTGGTGSFGTALVKYLIKYKEIPETLTIYSRDWQKQKELRDSIGNPDWINWVIGDVRDGQYLKDVIKKYHCDTVIHAAAIKCIVACEDNPSECLKTNVIGTQNVIDAIKIRPFIEGVLISTDKAVLPINTYGTSKKMAEKLWINAGYDVCRYGNVIGSNGSVLPLYKKLIAEGAESLPVTDERMTRFWYKMQDAIEFVLKAVNFPEGGKVHIPEIPSIRITDLCKALGIPYHVTGIRPGEKLHEYMIPPDEITGSEGYSSGNNPRFLTVEEIIESLKE